ALASELFDGHRIACTVEGPADASRIVLTSEQRRHLYLILKESLTNALRHAKARHVAVQIGVSQGTLCVDVGDDGVGMNEQNEVDAPFTRGGRGLQNLRHRAALLDGTVR